MFESPLLHVTADFFRPTVRYGFLEQSLPFLPYDTSHERLELEKLGLKRSFSETYAGASHV